MKNAAEATPATNVPTSPAISAESLTVNFTVAVYTGTEQEVFTVTGGFDLPAALNPAQRFNALDDFEIFLNRCAVGPSKIMLLQYVLKLTDADRETQLASVKERREKQDNKAVSCSQPSMPLEAFKAKAMEFAEYRRKFPIDEIPVMPSTLMETA